MCVCMCLKKVCVHVNLSVSGCWDETSQRFPVCSVDSVLPPGSVYVCILLFLPVSELRAQGEVVSKEVLLWWDWPLQPEEGVVLHTGLPQVFTGPVVHHVET